MTTSYAKVGGPPEFWMWVKVRDLDTGEFVDDVTEVNCHEGWLIRFIDPEHSQTEKVLGRYEVVRL